MKLILIFNLILKKETNYISSVCTLVLVVVHPILGGVIVFSQTSSLCRIGFIGDVVILFLHWPFRSLFRFLAVGQRLEHGEVVTLL